MSLQDFNALYEYLLQTSNILAERGAIDLSTEVKNASALASGLAIGLTTEFIGEARIALSHVLDRESGILSADEKTEMRDVVKQLTASLNGWPVSPNQ